MRVYTEGAEHARSQGLILADTKLEFGTVDDELLLIDEVLTPDSSRYWAVDEYGVGSSPPSFDKQFARDYYASLDWDQHPARPAAPGGDRHGHAVALRRRLRAHHRRRAHRLVRRFRRRIAAMTREDGSVNFDVRVDVTHLPGVLDPQGATVERALPALGYDNVSGVSIAKTIRLVVDAPSEDAARAQVVEMCERLLANPVIERYTVTFASHRAGT